LLKKSNSNTIRIAGGSAVLSGLTKDMGIEYAALLMTAIVGTYTYVGGLGATFYVSFFNTAIIMLMMVVFVIRVYDDSGNDNSNPLGRFYQTYKCLFVYVHINIFVHFGS
jgi:Na+(H+)/acetate symporter ActP